METNKIETKIIFLSWIIAIVCSIIIFLIKFDIQWMMAYFIGALTSIMNFNLLKKNIDRIISKSKKGATIFTFSNYLIRLFIYGVVLVLVFQKNDILIWFTFGGFFTVKIAIYINAIMNR